jgi:hypothetical protein
MVFLYAFLVPHLEAGYQTERRYPLSLGGTGDLEESGKVAEVSV